MPPNKPLKLTAADFSKSGVRGRHDRGSIARGRSLAAIRWAAMRRALLIVAGAILVAGIALVVRIQTTLPYYDRAVLHVKLHRSGLDALAESLLSEPEIDFVAYSNEGGVIAGSPSKIRVDLKEPTRQKYQKLFDRARLYFIAKHEAYSGHAFIELGSGSRFGRDFGVMLLYGPGPSSERCSEQYRHQDSGHCHFELGGALVPSLRVDDRVRIAAQQAVAADEPQRVPIDLW